MKTAKYLFPRYFKWIGLSLFFLSLLGLGYVYMSASLDSIQFGFFRVMHDNPYPSSMDVPSALVKSFGDSLIDEFVLLALTLSLVFIAFAREKSEDEYVLKIRLESFMWSIIVDTSLIVLAIFLLHDVNFVLFMGLNFYLILLLFIVKFRIAIFRFNKLAKNEE